VKVLLLFLFVALLLGLRAARYRPDGSEARLPAWQLVALSVVVGLSFLSLRVI
jgi:hypothetical protein